MRVCWRVIFAIREIRRNVRRGTEALFTVRRHLLGALIQYLINARLAVSRPLSSILAGALLQFYELSRKAKAATIPAAIAAVVNSFRLGIVE